MVPLDVTSDESVADALQVVAKHTARLDVLINNAGAPGHVTEGTDSIIRMATLGPDGPTGTFEDRLGPVDW
jgi:NAD(P)-dependent dehydrogenase (short-subunit alcohol dehydrogenase family)